MWNDNNNNNNALCAKREDGKKTIIKPCNSVFSFKFFFCVFRNLLLQKPTLFIAIIKTTTTKTMKTTTTKKKKLWKKQQQKLWKQHKQKEKEKKEQ
jgi:hypothetical protein